MAPQGADMQHLMQQACSLQTGQHGEVGMPLCRWQSAVGNIEDAKVALDVIARAIDDAVYLDEDAYNQMIPLQQYTRTIEVVTSS